MPATKTLHIYGEKEPALKARKAILALKRRHRHNIVHIGVILHQEENRDYFPVTFHNTGDLHKEISEAVRECDASHSLIK